MGEVGTSVERFLLLTAVLKLLSTGASHASGSANPKYARPRNGGSFPSKCELSTSKVLTAICPLAQRSLWRLFNFEERSTLAAKKNLMSSVGFSGDTKHLTAVN
jgi:hypothetical protein